MAKSAGMKVVQQRRFGLPREAAKQNVKRLILSNLIPIKLNAALSLLDFDGRQ